MNTVLQSFGAACAVLAVTELAASLCSENGMVKFTRSLAALVLLLSAVSGLFSLDWDLSFSQEAAQSRTEELSAYVEGQTASAVRTDAEEYLRGLLAAADLQTEKILAETDIQDGGSIVLTKVSALFRYPTEAERAGALLENVLGESVKVEVGVDEG